MIDYPAIFARAAELTDTAELESARDECTLSEMEAVALTRACENTVVDFADIADLMNDSRAYGWSDDDDRFRSVAFRARVICRFVDEHVLKLPVVLHSRGTMSDMRAQAKVTLSRAAGRELRAA